MTDRYAAAVRRRREDLRAQRVLLAAGCRGEVRTACALTRVMVTSEVAATVAELAREIVEHVERGPRRDRSRLPGQVAAAAAVAQADVVSRAGAVLAPALRRIATLRGLDPAAVDDLGAAVLAAPVVPRPAAPGRWPPVVSAGPAWRLALLPVVGIPAVGLPAVAGPAAVGPAVALALLGLGWGAATRLDAVERARWRRWAGTASAAVGAALDAAVLATLLEAEHRAGAALDAATRARLAVVDAELVALAPREDVRALG